MSTKTFSSKSVVATTTRTTGDGKNIGRSNSGSSSVTQKTGGKAATPTTATANKGTSTASKKPELPTYPVACWRAIKNLNGDNIFGPNSKCNRIDLLKKGCCPFLGPVAVMPKKKAESDDDDDGSDSSSSDEPEKPTYVTAFICGAKMPAKRVEGQNLCDKHHAEFLEKCAERDAIREQKQAAFLERQAAWQEREQRRLAAKQRYEAYQQRLAEREQRKDNDPAYFHAREDEIYEEVEEERFLADGTRETRKRSVKVFDRDTRYTRWDVREAGYCAFLHTENDECMFRCIAPLDPKRPRDSMCPLHMEAWHKQLAAKERRNYVGPKENKEQKVEEAEKEDNGPKAPTFLSIALQAEEKEKANKKLSKKERKAAAKKAALERAAAEAAVEAGIDVGEDGGKDGGEEYEEQPEME